MISGNASSVAMAGVIGGGFGSCAITRPAPTPAMR